jgi:hypothetical protein
MKNTEIAKHDNNGYGLRQLLDPIPNIFNYWPCDYQGIKARSVNELLIYFRAIAQIIRMKLYAEDILPRLYGCHFMHYLR